MRGYKVIYRKAPEGLNDHIPDERMYKAVMFTLKLIRRKESLQKALEVSSTYYGVNASELREYTKKRYWSELMTGKGAHGGMWELIECPELFFPVHSSFWVCSQCGCIIQTDGMWQEFMGSRPTVCPSCESKLLNGDRNYPTK